MRLPLAGISRWCLLSLPFQSSLVAVTDIKTVILLRLTARRIGRVVTANRVQPQFLVRTLGVPILPDFALGVGQRARRPWEFIAVDSVVLAVDFFGAAKNETLIDSAERRVASKA
jgi:hypothetical protein